MLSRLQSDEDLLLLNIVNGEKIHRWDEYPGGQDMRVEINFYLFDEEEFMSYKQQMRPWGNTDGVQGMCVRSGFEGYANCARSIYVYRGFPQGLLLFYNGRNVL